MPTINSIIEELKKSGVNSKAKALSDLEEMVKPVKLSDVVERLKKENSPLRFDCYQNVINGYDEDGFITFSVRFNDKITFIWIQDLAIKDRCKFLYSLWINGNEIINDLEVKE